MIPRADPDHLRARVGPGGLHSKRRAGEKRLDVDFEQAGPAWSAVAFEGHPSARAAWQEGTLRWSYEEGIHTVAPRVSSICSFVHTSLATVALGGAYEADSSVDCEGQMMDVWSFEAQGEATLALDGPGGEPLTRAASGSMGLSPVR